MPETQSTETGACRGRVALAGMGLGQDAAPEALPLPGPAVRTGRLTADRLETSFQGPLES
jgi:hypothetical protein